MNLQDWNAVEKDINQNREAVIDKLVDFALNDVLLFWSTDKKVQQEQEKKWSPILAWANKIVNGEFRRTTAIDIYPENQDTSLKLRNYLSSLSEKELSGFYIATLNMRSVLLALALVKGRITAEQAFELAELEELYQANKWGAEPVAEARRNGIKDTLKQVEQYLRK